MGNQETIYEKKKGKVSSIKLSDEVTRIRFAEDPSDYYISTKNVSREIWTGDRIILTYRIIEGFLIINEITA